MAYFTLFMIVYDLFLFLIFFVFFLHLLNSLLYMKILLEDILLFIKGWTISEEQRETFLECQMCERNACQFRSCSNLSASSIFCKNISDRFQGKTTSTLMSNHSTSDVMFASRSTTGNYDQHQLPTTNDRLQNSGNYILL